MQSRKGFTCVLGVAWLLSACVTYSRTSTQAEPVTVPVASEGAPAVIENDRVQELVRYAAQLSTLSPVVLRTEYLRTLEVHRRDPDAYSRIKLAALISVRQAPFRDDLQARELLSKAADESKGDDSDAHGLAVLWMQQLDERISLERALEDERRQRQTLQRKLDQLKSIEEEIDRRPAPPVVPGR